MIPFLLFAMFASPALAVQLDCSTLPQDRNTVVLFNFNNQDKIVDAARKAALERGENFVAISSDQSESITDETLYSTLDELKRCNAQMSSLILAAHDGGGYYWGGPNQSGFDHDTLMTAMRHYSSITSQIRSTYFWGCNSNARGILRGIYQPSQRAKQKGEVQAKCDSIDLACRNHQKHFDKFFYGAFPINTTWGDDQSALSNNSPIATTHLYLLLKKEHQLSQMSSASDYVKALNEIRCRSTTFLTNPACGNPSSAATAAAASQVSIAGTNGNCYYHLLVPASTGQAGPKHGAIEVSYLNRAPSADFCRQELNTFDGSLLTPLLEARKLCDGEDCSDNNPADMRDIPDNTNTGKVREVYEFFMGDSDCQLVHDPSVASQFPNITLLRDLLFYNRIRNSIVANHAKEISAFNNDANSLQKFKPRIEQLRPQDINGGCAPKQTDCSPRTLTRAQLLDKVRNIRREVQENLRKLGTSAPENLLEADFLSSGFYQLLTLEPDSTFQAPHCGKGSALNSSVKESCRLNSMIPPGWAEEAPSRSPIFGSPTNN